MQVVENLLFNIIINIGILIIGGIMLIKCADVFVDSASTIAKKLKISTLVIGLTIVALGTSLPEFAVSLVSALRSTGTSDIALGNIIGSNSVNITLILGIGTLFGPILVNKSIRRRDIPFMIGSALLFLIFGFFFNQDNIISMVEGIILLVVTVIYVFILIKNSKPEENEEDHIKPFSKMTLVWLLVGVIGIAVGAELVTSPASYLAVRVAVAFNVDEVLATTLVGLTIVAVGTSLPELITTISAAKKGQNNLVLGNVIGSNILNILFIIGVSSTITPLKFNDAILIDLVLMFGITVMVSFFAFTGNLTKKTGIFLISFYGFYVLYLILRTLGIFWKINMHYACFFYYKCVFNNF